MLVVNFSLHRCNWVRRMVIATVIICLIYWFLIENTLFQVLHSGNLYLLIWLRSSKTWRVIGSQTMLVMLARGGKSKVTSYAQTRTWNNIWSSINAATCINMIHGYAWQFPFELSKLWSHPINPTPYLLRMEMCVPACKRGDPKTLWCWGTTQCYLNI